MSYITVMPFLVPLFAAIASALTRKTRYRDYVSVAGSLLYAASVGVLANRVLSSGAVTHQMGGWAAPYGITFVADPLAVFMLLMTAFVSFAGNLYSLSYIGDEGKSSGYFAFFHFMVAGMSGAFVTGDLFNLFVMFELVLMSSYAMVSYSGTRESLFTSLKYVVLNLIGSSLMLVSIGGLYSVTGTLNMADMAAAFSNGAVPTAPVLGLSMILFCVFGIKSGLVPFHFWAPAVYSNSPPPAAAMMAGISKKVGIYAIIRLYVTVFSATSVPGSSALFANRSVGSVVGVVAVAMSILTVLVGGASAINHRKLDRLLSYSSVGQVGFIVMPVGFAMASGSSTAVVAALIYLLGHSLAKPCLFMLSGIVEEATGSTDISELGGLSELDLQVSAAYFIAAFSLVGIPPLLGFFGKMTVFRSAIAAQSWHGLAVLVLGALMTLLYFGKSWLEVFFGEPVDADFSSVPAMERAAVALLAAGIVLAGLGIDPIYSLAQAASESAVDTQGYVETVMGDSR